MRFNEAEPNFNYYFFHLQGTQYWRGSESANQNFFSELLSAASVSPLHDFHNQYFTISTAQIVGPSSKSLNTKTGV